MWFSKLENGYLGWFTVVNSAGTLRTGIPSGSFVATIRNPQDSASSLPVVTESGKLGLYKFFVSSSFLSTYGTGNYAVVVEVNATAPALRDVFSNVLQIFEKDFDSQVTLATSSISSIVSGSASQVWSSQSSTNTLSGTMGALLLSASQGPTPVIDTGAIATAVWDRQLSSHPTTGSAGYTLSQVGSSTQIVSSSLSLIATDIEFIKSIEGGRWKIISNQMIFYASDNVTEVARFNLFDASGVPTEDAVYERVRV